MMNRLNLKQFTVGLLLLAWSAQLPALNVNAQRMPVMPNQSTAAETTDKKNAVTQPGKVAPDLEETVDGMRLGRQRDEMQQVIIQLKSDVTVYTLQEKEFLS